MGDEEVNPVHYSSKSCEWATPQAFFDKLDGQFHFDLDVCATPENAKCKNFYSLAKGSGLNQPWHEHATAAFMNPPYGRQIGDWVHKATDEWFRWNLTVVALLPARTDTRWFHAYVLPYAELHWVPGRLKFGGAKSSAPFPSVVAVFRGAK